MNTRSGLVASIAGASLLLGIADAYAAPSSVYIEGTTAYYIDYTTGEVASYSGQPFSITVDLDLANGTVSSDGTTNINAFSLRGCRYVVDGLCLVDYGGQLPVVTDYSIAVSFAPVGGYRPIPTGDYLWDYTSRLNQSVTGMDRYTIERDQGQCIVTARDPTAYLQSCIEIRFYVHPTTNVNTMFGSLANLMNLNITPNLADVPPDFLGFTYSAVWRIDSCTAETGQDPECTPAEYLPGSAVWEGTLTSVVPVGGGGPTTKDACKKDGWKQFGFRNQGQCVSYVNHRQ
jgi:hypothetical protein